MKQNTLKENLAELLEHTELQKDASYCMKITQNNVSMIGIMDEPILINNGIIIFTKGDQTEIIGHLNNKFINTRENNNTECQYKINLILGVDNRKNNNKKIYVREDGEIILFDNTKQTEKHEHILIFWQYGINSCLTTFSSNPLFDKPYCNTISTANIAVTTQYMHLIEQLIQISNNNEG